MAASDPAADPLDDPETQLPWNPFQAELVGVGLCWE